MLGDNLKKFRTEMGISQRELGRRVGKTGQYISYLENNKNTNPSLDVLTQISKVLNINTNDLIGFAINIEMHESERITPKGQKLQDNSDLLKQTITNASNLRTYYLAGDNTQLIIDLKNELLVDIMESDEFFSGILNSNDFEKLRNKNYTIDDLKKDKTIENILKDCSKMPICMAKACIDLYNIFSHTKNLVNIATEQRLGTTLPNDNKIIEKANLSNDEYKNLGEEILHLIEFELFKMHNNK